MLQDFDVIATVAVRDLAVARRFYEQTLGLTPIDSQDGEVVTYKSGGSKLGVYRSDYAGTNKATAIAWNVGRALDDVVGKLKAKGVKFEHYDLPGMTRSGDIHVAGDIKVAWFKDPDGNILNVTNY